MTIGNDSFTNGTAAVAAGGANIVAQKKDVIKSALTTTSDAFVTGTKATIKKETYTKFAAGLKDALRKTVDKETYKKIGNVISEATKKAIKKDTYKGLFDKKTYTALANKLTAINWKRAGKYAGVAAGVATALVLAKNFFFSSNNDVEEI